MQKLSIIIPAFNEEKTIQTILKKVAAVPLTNWKKEIIIVNDGSRDATAKKVLEYKKKQKDIIFINNTVNQGKGAAVREGIQKATGDYILIQDADMEYDPQFIPHLLSVLDTSKKMAIYGTRLKKLPRLREEDNALFLLHFFGNRFLSLVTSVLYGQWITDMETGYKVFPKNALKNVKLYGHSFDFEPEITAKLLRQGYKVIEVPIKENPRWYGEGKKLNALHDGPIALWTLVKYRFVR